MTIYRALLKVYWGAKGATVIEPGFQNATVHDARIFVLPNPSGRNANFSYGEMLAAFRRAAAGAINEPRRARRAARGRRFIRRINGTSTRKDSAKQAEQQDERHHRCLLLHHPEERRVSALGRGDDVGAGSEEPRTRGFERAGAGR